MRGYVYVLKSPERPSVVKIGKTTKSPFIRCTEHNRNWYLSLNTWEVHFWRWVENCGAAEAGIHRLFIAHNLGAKGHREAFRIDLAVAMETVVRVCDAYPAKSDHQIDPIMKRRAVLDRAAYRHIQKRGPLSEKIVSNWQLLSETDFYKWLNEIKEHIDV
jgi:hypothetical protein